jgi:hypothetical protein
MIDSIITLRSTNHDFSHYILLLRVSIAVITYQISVPKTAFIGLANMAEPIPSATSAADAADDETSQNLPNNAEDRKAAAALNSLNANAMSQENGESAAKQPSAADQEALGKAMSRLEIASGLKKSDAAKKPEQKKDAEPKKKIKISSEDVTFIVRDPVPICRVTIADRLPG